MFTNALYFLIYSNTVILKKKKKEFENIVNGYVSIVCILIRKRISTDRQDHKNKVSTIRDNLVLYTTVESPKMDTPKIGQPLYNGQTSWNGMTEFIVRLRKTDISTTDKSHALNVSVIRRLNYICYEGKIFVGP